MTIFGALYQIFSINLPKYLISSTFLVKHDLKTTVFALKWWCTTKISTTMAKNMVKYTFSGNKRPKTNKKLLKKTKHALKIIIYIKNLVKNP